jgi:predicted GNAT family N-acyltransferase
MTDHQTPAYRIHLARWPDDQAAIRSVRHRVFVVEQGVPESLEWDGRDGEALQLLALDEAGEAVGTARLLPEGRIGRMAVLPGHRGRGIGGRLLQTLLEEARRRGLDRLELHAQRQVVNFYRRYGFLPIGEEYLEAGIPHRRMVQRPVQEETEG